MRKARCRYVCRLSVELLASSVSLPLLCQVTCLSTCSTLRKHTDVQILTWYLAALAATALVQDFVAVHLATAKVVQEVVSDDLPDAEEVKKLCAVKPEFVPVNVDVSADLANMLAEVAVPGHADTVEHEQKHSEHEVDDDVASAASRSIILWFLRNTSRHMCTEHLVAQVRNL